MPMLSPRQTETKAEEDPSWKPGSVYTWVYCSAASRQGSHKCVSSLMLFPPSQSAILAQSYQHPGGGGGGDSHMKQTGMLVGNFEFSPQKETIWAWLKVFVTPKGDQSPSGPAYSFVVGLYV